MIHDAGHRFERRSHEDADWEPGQEGPSTLQEGFTAYPTTRQVDPRSVSNNRINPLAVASLIFGLTVCLSLGGIIFGVTALRQIKQDGGRGKGLAVIGLTLGATMNGIALILAAISLIAEG